MAAKTYLWIALILGGFWATGGFKDVPYVPKSPFIAANVAVPATSTVGGGLLPMPATSTVTTTTTSLA